jgi:fructokinase
LPRPILVLGTLVVDIIAAGLPKIASPGEVIYAPKGIVTRIGGHAANVSIDLVKLGFNPSSVVVVGCVGNDPYGDMIVDSLASYGLRVLVERKNGVETGKNLILVVRGEDRRFHEDLGANLRIDYEFVLKSVREEDPELVYVGAVGALGGLDEKLPRRLRELGYTLYVDFMEPYGKSWGDVAGVLRFSDIVHFNLVEAEKLVGETDPERACVKAVRKGAKLAVLTMGSRGLVAATRSWLVRMGCFRVEPVDPTGAGDAFSAALIKELYDAGAKPDSLDLEEAIDMLVYASAAGASAALGEGATSSVDRKTVLELIDSYGDELKSSAVARRLSF